MDIQLTCVLFALAFGALMFGIGWWAGQHIPMLWHYFNQ